MFERQIERGGPVTVTHPDIVRYFMTIPEATGLVLQAGSMARGGEVFVLDMGEPVKILDLAINMIRLSGMEPGKDIRIEFVGLRPGEKLVEELLIAGEGVEPTSHNKILCIRNHNHIAPGHHLHLEGLIDAALRADPAEVIECLRCVVHEYTPSRVAMEVCEAGPPAIPVRDAI